MGCVTGFINQHLLLESVLYEYNMSDIQQQQTTVRNDVLITFVFHNCFHNRTSQTTITKYVLDVILTFCIILQLFAFKVKSLPYFTLGAL